MHRGIEAIALLELDGEAFRQIARTHAGGIETLQDRQHGVDLGSRRAQLLSDQREIAVEIAGLVDEIDEILPDHAPRRIDHRKRELLGEMIGQRGLDRDEGLEIVVAVVAPARTGARPFGIARRRLAVRARGRGVGVGGGDIVKLRPRLLLGCAVASVRPLGRPIRRGGTW